MYRVVRNTTSGGAAGAGRVKELARHAGVLIMLVVFTLLGAARAAASLDEDVQRFLAWFPGEYDNNEQVWQQQTDGLSGDELHERIHHRFVPVSLPELGEYVFFVLQTMDDDLDRVYRQRIYLFEPDPDEGAIRLTIFRMPDEERYADAWQDSAVLDSLDAAALSTSPGCEVYWRFNGDFFDGTMKDGACHFYSERSGKEIYVTDTLRLTDSELWIGDKAFDAEGNKIFGRDEPHRNRKVRRFTGWMGLKKSVVDPSYEGDARFFASGFSIHTEGGKVQLLDDDGKPTGYTIELAQLTYQNTRVPILKLGVIDDSTGKTAVYSWADTSATRIGINVRWFQAGLTAEE